MADNNTIARPYAQAVFEVAGDNGMLAAWSQALNTARCLLADGQAASFLANPALNARQRFEFLAGLFKAVDGESSILAGGDSNGANFLKLLLEYGRVSVLPEIAEHFDALKAAIENTVDVTVTAAAPVNEAQQLDFAQALRARLGRDIRLEIQIDETLIGGAIISAGDVVIDGSLRSRLDGLASALTG